MWWRRLCRLRVPPSVSGTGTCAASRYLFFFSSRRRHTRLQGDWSSDVCSSDLLAAFGLLQLAGDVLVRDHHLGDLLLLQEPLELAVGQDLDRLGALPRLLDEQHRDQREDDVSDVKARAAFHKGVIFP